MKIFFATLLCLLAARLLTATAWAYEAAPDQDIWVDDDAGGQVNDGAYLVAASTGFLGTCRTNNIALLRWDVSSLAGGNPLPTTLSLFADAGAVDAGNWQLNLYAVADDTWQETDTTVEVALGTLLATTSLSATPAGQPAVFADPALDAYVYAEAAADGFAGFAVAIACGDGFLGYLQLDSADPTDPDAVVPRLTTGTPTAVGTVATARPAAGPDAVVTSALLAALAVTGALVTRAVTRRGGAA